MANRIRYRKENTMVGRIIRLIDKTGLSRTVKIYGFKTPGDMGKWVMFDLGKRFKIIDVHTFGEVTQRDLIDSLSPKGRNFVEKFSMDGNPDEVIRFGESQIN